MALFIMYPPPALRLVLPFAAWRSWFAAVLLVCGGGKIGELSQKLYDTLTGIQWGRVEDTYGWTKPIE